MLPLLLLLLPSHHALTCYSGLDSEYEVNITTVLKYFITITPY